MVYNTTNITNANNFYEIIGAVNQLSGDWLASFILFGIFLMILIMFSGRYEIKTLLVADSFICSFLAVLMLYIGFIGYLPLIAMLITFFGALFTYLFTSS